MSRTAWLVACLLSVLLAGCGSSDAVDGSSSLPPLPAPDGQGLASPAAGASRAGISYDVTIRAADGERIAFTVHEPLAVVGGEKYPLLMNGPGFALPRTPALLREALAPPGTPLADIATTRQFTDAGYG